MAADLAHIRLAAQILGQSLDILPHLIPADQGGLADIRIQQHYLFPHLADLFGKLKGDIRLSLIGIAAGEQDGLDPFSRELNIGTQGLYGFLIGITFFSLVRHRHALHVYLSPFFRVLFFRPGFFFFPPI